MVSAASPEDRSGQGTRLAQHDALARNPPSLAPDLLSPTDAAVATVRDGKLEFVWTEVEGAQRYAFYFGKSNPPPLVLADLATGVATVPAATLPPGVYYWKAAGLNDHDSGESSVFAVMVPEPAPTPIAASPAAAPAAGMVAADAAPQAANEMAPARQAPVALDTRYTHQVFGNKDSENTYYFNAADQLIQVTPQGEISLAGTVATMQEPRFVVRIDGTNHLEAAIDANGAIWAER